MLEIFRNWIVAMLCLAILIIIVQLILPKTNLRKYVYSLIGIITVITVISPVVDLLKNGNVENSISQILSNVEGNQDTISVNSDGLENTKNELVKVQFVENLKSDIMFKLADKKVQVNDINIIIDDEYNITKVEIKIAKNEDRNINNINEIVSYINSEYDIDYSKITITEEVE